MLTFAGFLIRDWEVRDRAAAAEVIRSVLAEYGLGWEVNCGQCTDQDAVEVEKYYWATGGEFWVVESQGRIVGTGGYYPIARGKKAAEIRKMYLLPEARGQQLGRFLLSQLETTAVQNGYTEIWIKTASVLKQAVSLYEQNGYAAAAGVETDRCDKVYRKIMVN